MVRRYADRPVEPQQLDRVLEHALRAPSAGFTQGWAFLRLDSTLDVDRFWRATTPAGSDTTWLSGMRTAPALIVPMTSRRAYLERYAEPDKGWTDRSEARWPVPYWYVDAGMAAMLILLTAVDEGLGACFFGIPADRLGAFRAEFGVPDDYEPVGAITLGHRTPALGVRGSPRRRRRRPRRDVVHHGHWGVPEP